MNRLYSLIQTFLRASDGNVAAVFALSIPVIYGGVAIAVDSASLYRIQTHIQSIADSTALATAKELHVYGSDPATLSEAGKNRAEALLAQADLSSAPHSIDVVVDEEAGTAQVDIRLMGKALLPMPVLAENPVRVTARARTYGETRLCVLGLSPNAAEAVRAKEMGTVSAPDCAVQSNSTDPASILSETGGRFTAKQICASGGVVGPTSAFRPDPARTDCPPISDPLAGRAPPTYGSCDPALKNFSVKSGTHTIRPGVYCGGIFIANQAVVTALPGEYILLGGKLDVGQDSVLRGDGVHFYFADNRALFQFKDRSVIELAAPSEGRMAGILFFENRAAQAGRNFTIGSGNVKKLLGTIYLPKATLNIEANGNIASESAYTVIIAQRLDLKVATLVVNANYASTNVPVPEGMVAGAAAIGLEQ